MTNVCCDGLRITYQDTGGHGPALLCMTGWCSDSERYAALVPRLAVDRRVVTFDWRGHGASEREVEDFGVGEQVRDALAVVQAAGLERFITVSASHSGWVALELRRRLGERIPRMVLMDWMVTVPSAAYLDLTRTLTDRRGWPEARDRLIGIWRAGGRLASVDRALETMRQANAAMWQRSGREITGAYQRTGSPLRALECLDSVPPVLHVYGQPRDPEFLAEQERYAAEHQWFEVCQVPAQSHFSMIESPCESAEAILRFTEDLASK